MKKLRNLFFAGSRCTSNRRLSTSLSQPCHRGAVLARWTKLPIKKWKNLRVVSSIPDGVWLFSLPNIPKWKQKNQMKWMKLMKRMKLKKLMILRKQNYFCINGEHRKVLALSVPISLKIPGFHNPGNFSDIARAPPGALASISSITLATVRRREPVPFSLTILPLILP